MNERKPAKEKKKNVVERAVDWLFKANGPNREQRRRSKWIEADGVPSCKHGPRARTGKSGGTKVNRFAKHKRKIAQHSRRQNRRK